MIMSPHRLPADFERRTVLQNLDLVRCLARRFLARVRPDAAPSRRRNLSLARAKGLVIRRDSPSLPGRALLASRVLS